MNIPQISSVRFLLLQCIIFLHKNDIKSVLKLYSWSVALFSMVFICFQKHIFPTWYDFWFLVTRIDTAVVLFNNIIKIARAWSSPIYSHFYDKKFFQMKNFCVIFIIFNINLGKLFLKIDNLMRQYNLVWISSSCKVITHDPKVYN